VEKVLPNRDISVFLNTWKHPDSAKLPLEFVTAGYKVAAVRFNNSGDRA